MPERITPKLVSFRRFAKRTLMVLTLVLLALEVIKRVLDLL